jgi:hypothetical protein
MNTTPAIAPELLTAPQAAEYLGIGQRTLARWSADGKAPAPLKLTPGRRGALGRPAQQKPARGDERRGLGRVGVLVVRRVVVVRRVDFFERAVAGESGHARTLPRGHASFREK